MKIRMKQFATGIAFFSIFILISFALPDNSKKLLVSPKDTIPDSVDLTGYFTDINKDKVSSEFKKGTVEITDLAPNFKRTENGFEIQLSNTNVPSPVIYNGKVYVSGGFGSKQYYAFDAKTGKKIWSVNLDDDGPSSAAIVDDIIVFNTESCTIFACNAETGEQIWSYWLGDPLMSMPTIANGIVFTAYPSNSGTLNLNNIQQNKINNIQDQQIEQTNNQQYSKRGNISHIMIAIELKTGKILWQKRIDGDVMSAPVANGNELYVSTFAGTLFKFKQKTGEIISAKSIRATSAPVIYKDHIYLSQRSDVAGEDVSESIVNYSADSIVRTSTYVTRKAPYLDKTVQEKSKLKSTSTSYDAGNGFAGGAPVSSGWMTANENIGQSNVSSLQSFQGSRTLYNQGYSYNTMGDELICTDVKLGKESWKLKIHGDLKTEGGFMGTPPIIAGNNIILASFNGEITVHDPQSGKVSKKIELKENIRYQPVAQDGWIYVTTTNGKLVAIDTGDKNITGWPMWGANPARTNYIK